MQLLKNGICGGGPFERLAVGIVVSDELIDALYELLEAGERAAVQGIFVPGLSVFSSVQFDQIARSIQN